MKTRLMAALLLTCALAAGEPAKRLPAAAKNPKSAVPPKAAVPAPAAKVSGVEAAIPDAVKALGEPAMMDFRGGIQMAVTAATEKAQAHVNQGMNHLHGGWEFEASRHFAAALREDPECLLAHWGMLMSLLTPSPESDAARVAVTARLLDLVDAGNGTELERGYCYGLIKYLEEGPQGAANAFRKIAENFPNDLQAGIFAALFSRGGYDEFGSATPDQEAAEKSLLALVAKFPQSPVPLNALLSVRADGPDLSASLDLAHQLSEMGPDYGPYLHLLGHYEWRTGQHAKAAADFAKASSHFEKWMKTDKVGVADCPEWVKAECYRIVALVSKGDFDTAYAAARQIAATPFAPARAASPGTRLLLWDAKTLPARILLHRDLPGNASEALASLPKPADLKPTHGKSLAYWWIDGLRFALEAKRLIDAKDFSGARDVANALTQHGEIFSKTQATANALGERSAWTRGFRALEVLASDLRGRIAVAGPKDRRGTAYNWFASAADRQHPASMMFPPMILTPMASRLGDYFLAVGQPKEAGEAFNRALVAFPNDMNALVGLKTSFEQAGQAAAAAAAEEKIRQLRGE